MAFRRLFNRKPPPTVAIMRIDQDVDGLLRALADSSPNVVRDAANAIGSLHLHGADASREKTAGAGPALVAAFMRQQAELANLKYYQGIEIGDRHTSQWAIVDALGTIRASAGEPLLRTLVADQQADAYLRGHAAAALGRIAGVAHFELLRGLLDASDTPPVLAEGAVAGLLAAGDAGAEAIEHAVVGTRRREFAAAVKKVLERESTGEYQESAKRILSAIAQEAAANAEEAAWQAGQREAWEQAVVAKRIQAFPLAAKLAALLGHPEWTAGRNLIKAPRAGGYDEAVATCRELGLNVVEQEKLLEVSRVMGTHGYDEPDETEISTFEVSADVDFEGESFVILGGRRERRMLI